MTARQAGRPDPADAELTGLAEELRNVVGSFVRRVRRGSETPRAAWSETLGDLDRDGPMSIAVLARLRDVRHQSMRLVVVRLETAGLVHRAADPSDARGQVIDLTPAGRSALAASRSARTDWIADALQSQATPRERQALREAIIVLRRLATIRA